MSNDPILFKDNQMRSPPLLSGPKIRKAYFDASNPKMLLQSPTIKSDLMGVFKQHFLFEGSKKALRIFGPDKSDVLLV